MQQQSMGPAVTASAPQQCLHSLQLHHELWLTSTVVVILMVRHWCVVSQDDATVNMCSVLHCGCCGVFFLKLGGMANVLGIEHTSNWCAHENSPQSSGPGFRSSCISIAVSWLCFADFVLFSSFFSSVLKFYSTQGSRAITQPSTSWANPVWLPWSDEKGYVLDCMAVACWAMFYAVTETTKNQTCLSIRSWNCLQCRVLRARLQSTAMQHQVL